MRTLLSIGTARSQSVPPTFKAATGKANTATAPLGHPAAAVEVTESMMVATVPKDASEGTTTENKAGGTKAISFQELLCRLDEKLKSGIASMGNWVKTIIAKVGKKKHSRGKRAKRKAKSRRTKGAL